MSEQLSAAVKNFTGNIHLVFSSHWDREWYWPFQKYRAKLVRLLDTILAELESGRLPFYQMDGQLIPIEDYLEIRPEREAQIRKLVAAGRLRVGPWYDLADEFLVSGESLVRNLLLGMKRAEALGQTSRVGWLCDLFGHNSQSPQLLQQAGIDNAILWRGIDRSVRTPFWWVGADGTRVLVHLFPPWGYSAFAIAVRRAFSRTETPSPDQMVDNALAYLDEMLKTTDAKNLLWFDGADHLEFDPALLEFAKKFNARVGREVVKVSTLDHFVAALKREKLPKLGEWRGEMRVPSVMPVSGELIHGVGSSRIPLKRANHAGETLLTLWAEPWCAAAALVAGIEYPTSSLELAWEYLLRNHPHDSICGCSPDETHNAMPYRFDQSRQIAEAHLDRALETLAAMEHKGVVGEDEIGLSIFAPFGGATQNCPEVTFRLPNGWPQFNEFFGFETKPSFRIFRTVVRVPSRGKDGGTGIPPVDSKDGQAGCLCHHSENLEEIRYQLLEVKPQTGHLRVAPNKFPSYERRQGVRLALETKLDAASAQHFIIKRASGPTRITHIGAIGVARNRLRNEFLEITAENDGTLTLTDLRTGRAFGGLLAMEDTADIGDGWYHGVALQDVGYLSTGGNATFGITENGPLLARLNIRVEWQVPRDFNFKDNKRSAELTPLVVEHRVTLRKGNEFVEIETTVHNTVRDHRLRIFAPTGFANAKTFFADTPFDAVERAIGLREDNHLMRELQVEMTPQQNWIAATDGKQGLAFLAPAQYESAMLDQPDRPLCVTLLRAFRKAVFTDGNEGGQIQGNHTFQLGLMPFRSSKDTPVPAVTLQKIAQSIAAPARVVYLDAQDLKESSANKVADISLLPRIEGEVVMSACHQSARRRWTLRVFNPTLKPQKVKLLGGKNWQTTDFRGRNAQKISGNTVTLKPKQVMTLQVGV
jgi:alpha-mannosidase/mannosylglycerate hydrolase